MHQKLEIPKIGKKISNFTILSNPFHVKIGKLQKKHRKVTVKCNLCDRTVDLLLSNLFRQKGCKCQNKAEHLKTIARKEYGLSTINTVLRNYKREAKMRNLEYLLTDEQSIELFKQNCLYCDSEPRLIKHKKHYGDCYLNGIDRLDNNIGYTIKNSVPCCTLCNRKKQALTLEQFIAWIRKVYKNTEKWEI